MEQIIVDQIDQQITPQLASQLQLPSNNIKGRQNEEEYSHLTHINQLIAQIQPQRSNYSSYVNMFKSMFELTRHLFVRKNQNGLSFQQDSFDQYLNGLTGFKTGKKLFYSEYSQDTLQQTITNTNLESPSFSKSKKISSINKENEYKFSNKKKKHKDSQATQLQLIRCYEKVPYIYFQQKFVLNFGLFQKQSYSQSATVVIQTLNQNLDLVELNLFAQIHRKFHQYFKVVSNLDYLQESISINILKVKQVRKILKRNKLQYIDQTKKLRKKIIHRQNIQKITKSLKVIKSLNKLPAIVDTILKSSLPYQCLSLLQKTKDSLKSVHGLKCLTKIQDMIRNCEGTIQMSLSRRYTDQLYLYLLGDCQQINFIEKWSQIKYTINNNLNGDSQESININNINNNSSIMLDQSFQEDNPFTIKSFVLKRKEGKQYEIAMIILESFKFIEFSIQQGRVKINNFLRLFFKIYENQLGKYFKNVVQSSRLNKNQKSQSFLSEINDTENNLQQKQHKLHSKQSFIKQIQDEPIEQNLIQQLVNNLSIDYYIRHVKVLNQIFGQVINRYLGFIYTLVSQFQTKVKETMNKINIKSYDVNIQEFAKQRQKFKKLFQQQFTLLPILYKLITEKIKSLLILRNLNGVPYQDFYKWMSLLQYWLKSIDNIIQQHPLSSYDGQLSQVIDNVFRKTLIIAKQLSSTLKDLTINYIQVHHQNVLYNQMKPALQEDSWQSVQIPKQFQELLSSIILGKQKGNNNTSSADISILNDSTHKPLRIFQQQLNTSFNKIKTQQQTLNINIKVLKNTLLLEGVKYKISISLLLMCQFIDDYMKIGRLFCIDKKIIFQRLKDLIQYYNKMTYQLILGSKALNFHKIKTKNITARHMCLLCNCLSVLKIIILQIPQFEQATSLSESIQSHIGDIHKKLSSLLFKKIQTTINTQLQNTSGSNHMIKSKISQTNNTLLTTFLQMFQIVDENLQSNSCKEIFKESFQFFMQKYFVYMLQMTIQKQIQDRLQTNEIKIFLQKLKFMKGNFDGQFLAMEKQLGE